MYLYNREKICRQLFVYFISVIACTHCFSQTTISKDSAARKGTTVVIPGKEYNRSGYHDFFWGKHYRKEWNTPVRVNNFYLADEKGGLTPSQEGGSRQSKTLRLKGGDGKEYVLRSVNKDFGRGLDKIYQNTFITHIAKDQVSIGHPFAAITITPMAEAAGIYHTNPIIVFVPKQAALKNYNDKYGDELYLFEERADEDQQDIASFGNAKNVIGTPKLYEKIDGDNDNHVDQKAFARARLFDMFIGDWSRHPDQWRWAEFKNGDETTYRPIPRDRDQAYTRIDGLYPDMVGRNLRHVQGFKSTIRNVSKWNYAARDLDREFTNELTEQDWIGIAKDLQQRLSNDLIEKSIRLMPAQVFAISGQEIIEKLESRRDHLEEYAKDYYKALAQHVEIKGTNKKERFVINSEGKETSIKVYKPNKNTPYYSRTFHDGETKDVKIYGLAKEDIFDIRGNQRDGVGVKIIDPQGKDSFVVAPRANDKFFSGDKYEYDSLHEKKFNFSVKPLASPERYMIFQHDDPMNFVTSTGIRVSVNARYNEQPWRVKESENIHLLSFNYGFARKAFNFGYIGTWGHAIGNWDVVIKARADMPGVENFYGTGNETVNLKNADLYRVETRKLLGELGVERKTGYQTITVSGFYQQVKVTSMQQQLMTARETAEMGSPDNNKRFAGALASYHFRKTNNDVIPTRGFDFYLGGGYSNDLDRSSGNFGNITSSAAVYLPLGKSFSIASRAGGAAIVGDADFYHLNTLSGNETLRGYDRERFTGKTTFYNNNELRWLTNTRNYFFNGKMGLLAFYDQGRVWQPLEKSGKWHTGYGGGIIISPFNKVALTGIYALSEEDKRVILKAGFFF